MQKIWVRFTYFYPPLTGGHLKLTEGQGDYPGVGEEERRYECHDELPKEGLPEGDLHHDSQIFHYVLHFAEYTKYGL